MKYAHESETSFQAAVDNLPRQGTQKAAIYDTLVEVTQGLTRDELETVLHLSGNAVRPRVQELIEAGLVEETELTRRTRSGSKATVLVASNVGSEADSTPSLTSGVAASSRPPSPRARQAPPVTRSPYDPWEDAA